MARPREQTNGQRNAGYVFQPWNAAGVDTPDPLNIFSSPGQSGDGGQAFMDYAMNQYPGYQTAYDPMSMSATKSLEELYPQFNKGFNVLRDEALRKGPSNWLSMSLTNQALKSRDKKEKATLETAGQTAKAHDALAAIGGLSSGARERVQEQGQKNVMSMNQDLSRSDSLGELDMQVADEGNRVDKLNKVTGLEMGHLKEWENAKSRDTDLAMREKERLSQYNMDIYKTRMEAMASQRQAEATENSGKK